MPIRYEPPIANGDHAIAPPTGEEPGQRGLGRDQPEAVRVLSTT